MFVPPVGLTIDPTDFCYRRTSRITTLSWVDILELSRETFFVSTIPKINIGIITIILRPCFPYYRNDRSAPADKLIAPLFTQIENIGASRVTPSLRRSRGLLLAEAYRRWHTAGERPGHREKPRESSGIQERSYAPTIRPQRSR